MIGKLVEFIHPTASPPYKTKGMIHDKISIALRYKTDKYNTMDSKLTHNQNGSMTFEKTEPIKKKLSSKRRSTHKCSEKVQLDRMRVILVGNGDPKTGLAFKMEASIKDITSIKDDISEIKNQLKESITAASTAASSLEKYKIEVKAFNDGKDDVEEKQSIADELRRSRKRDKRMATFNIVALCLTMVGVFFAVFFGFRNGKTSEEIKLETRTTNDILAEPSIRGNVYNPFANDTIK